MKKHMPAANNDQNMLGNVKLGIVSCDVSGFARLQESIPPRTYSNRPRRPKVSMVHTAGQAKTKLTRPKPNEASSAVMLSAPALANTVLE